MQLTMTGEYAVRAMVYLAALPSGTIAQIQEVAREWDIPEMFLRKIIPRLAGAGLLLSQRGAGGGIALARMPEQVTMLDVIEAVEGPMYLNRCLMSSWHCSRTDWCPVHEIWCTAQEELNKVLTARSLADIAAAAARRHARHTDAHERQKQFA
ncbi:MAG: Rrf2 family transcriptional regulator [Bacteroidota bacterium]